MRELRQLCDENLKLKQVVADLTLDKQILGALRVICRRHLPFFTAADRNT